MKTLIALLLCCTSVYAQKLCVFDEEQCALLHSTSINSEIKSILNGINVRFEQWEASIDLPNDATEDLIKQAYKKDIEQLNEENGYNYVDVVRMLPDNPNREMARKKFLNEHTHGEDEVRFFVEGSGLFYLHADHKVFAVMCEQGDLISIPANYPHWFDMGDKPYFTAIRFFINPDGWIASFTESTISDNFIQ